MPIKGIEQKKLYNLDERKTLVTIEREYRNKTKKECYIHNGHTRLGFHVINKKGVHKTFLWREYGLSWSVTEVRSAFDFNDWGHYGIYDGKDMFYDNGQELSMFLESNIEFDTRWHGFKKEIQSMRVQRVFDKGIIVSVHEEMDDAIEQCDLICDCLTDEEEELLTDEMIEEIRELLMEDVEFSSEETATEIIAEDATLEDVLKTATELSELCGNKLHESFLSCMAITLDVVYNHPEDKSFIEERIAKEKAMKE